MKTLAQIVLIVFGIEFLAQFIGIIDYGVDGISLIAIAFVVTQWIVAVRHLNNTPVHKAILVVLAVFFALDGLLYLIDGEIYTVLADALAVAFNISALKELEA